MNTASTIREWESAEVLRSIVEAGQTDEASLRADEQNVRRYLDPPADTPFPLEYAFHLVGTVKGKTVLDYGCGNGENSLPLARRGARVIGLDVSQALLDLASLRMDLNGLKGRASFIAGSAHDVPLPDQSVDVVLGVAILHHLDLELAAGEIARLLKPGGRAIFQEPVRNSKMLRTIRGMIPYTQEDVSPYERPLTDGELRVLSRGLVMGRARAFSLPFINLAQVVPALRRQVLTLYHADAAILSRAPFLAPFAGIRVFELLKE